MLAPFERVLRTLPLKGVNRNGSTPTPTYTEKATYVGWFGDNGVGTTISAKITMKWVLKAGKLSLQVTYKLLDNGDPFSSMEGGVGGPDAVIIKVRKPSGWTYSATLKASNRNTPVPKNGKYYMVADKGSSFVSNTYSTYWITRAHVRYLVGFWAPGGHVGRYFWGAWKSNKFSGR